MNIICTGKEEVTVHCNTIKAADICIDRDGTVRSRTFNDIYFMPGCGVQESLYVFLKGNRIADRTQENLCILETGFGTGLNFLLTLQCWRETKNRGMLHFISVEKFPIDKKQLEEIYTTFPKTLSPYAKAFLQCYPPLVYGTHTRHIMGAKLSLIFADVNHCLKTVEASVNAVYLDGFAPGKNESMWSDSVFRDIYGLCAQDATLSSFTCAKHVRKSLEDVGFFVKKRKGFGRKRECITASTSLFYPPSPNKTVAVIGAGITGCTVAYYLQTFGFTVTLYDKNCTPMFEASGNPLVLANPRLGNGCDVLKTFNHQAFLHAISHYKKFPQCMTQTGTVRFPKEIENRNCVKSWIAAQGIDRQHMRFIGRRDACKILEFDAPSDGVFFPTLGAIDPKKLAKCLTRNIQFMGRTNIRDSSALKQDIHIFCPGSHVREHVGIKLPSFTPFTMTKGQILWTAEPLIPAQTACVHNGYVLCTPDKTVIGSSFQKIMAQEKGNFQGKGAEQYTPTHHREEILQKVESLLGNVTAENLICRTGIRVHAKNTLPCIMQTDKKTFFVTAMGSRGFLQAPYCAKILCSILRKEQKKLPCALVKRLSQYK